MGNEINQGFNPESPESINSNKNSKLNILLTVLVVLLLALGSYWFFVIYKDKDKNENKKIEVEENTTTSEVAREEIYCNCNVVRENFCTGCEIKVDDKLFSIYRGKQEEHFRDAELVLRNEDGSSSEVLIKNLILGTEMGSDEQGPKIERNGKYLIWNDGGVGVGAGHVISHEYIINSDTLEIYRILNNDYSSFLVQKIDLHGNLIEETYVGLNFFDFESNNIGFEGEEYLSKRLEFLDGDYIFDSLSFGDKRIELSKLIEWTKDSAGGLDYSEYYGPVRLEILDFDKNFIIFEINSEIEEIENKIFKYNVENKELYYEDGTEVN